MFWLLSFDLFQSLATSMRSLYVLQTLRSGSCRQQYGFTKPSFFPGWVNQSSQLFLVYRVLQLHGQHSGLCWTSPRMPMFICKGQPRFCGKTKHCCHGLTSAELRTRIMSLSLLAAVLLVQPRRQLASAAMMHCWLIICLESTSFCKAAFQLVNCHTY